MAGDPGPLLARHVSETRCITPALPFLDAETLARIGEIATDTKERDYWRAELRRFN